MSARDEVYSVLTADAEFTILVPAVYERSAVVDAPEPPFAVLAWGGRTPGISRMKQRTLTLFVHDHRGSYDHIEAALARAEALLLAATWSLGITSIEWLG